MARNEFCKKFDMINFIIRPIKTGKGNYCTFNTRYHRNPYHPFFEARFVINLLALSPIVCYDCKMFDVIRIQLRSAISISANDNVGQSYRASEDNADKPTDGPRYIKSL